MEQDCKMLIKISVRNLVEFILREGDIDSRTGSGSDKEAMQLGSKMHRKIQRRMGSEYQAEVSLKMKISYEEFDLQVEGRADGVLEETTGIFIDEIKGTLGELERIKSPIGIHLAQAKCYAYIYAKQRELSTIGVQMTYCQMETEALKQFREEYSLGELEQWFQKVVDRYEKWARFQVKWRETRNQSIQGVEFPFAYREGQKELVTAVYRTVLRKKKLFIQAPTGVGKTMATVFPAVKAMGEELGEKIFYLTAKTVTRTVAEQAFQTLKEQGLRCKVITLTAKEKICFCEEAKCNPIDCPYARGHYDRVNDAVYEMITTTDNMSRESLEAQAEKYQVCPFEMALDVSKWIDVIICDYNYVFDPNAHLRRFFSEGVSGNYLFLIDEAHNLVERGREMYSAVLYKEDMLQVKKEVKEDDPKLARRLEECNKLFLELKRECETYVIHNSVAHIVLKLMNVLTEMERYLEESKNEKGKEQVLTLFFAIRNFLSIHDQLDENYVIYTELEEDGRFKLKLFCINPAVHLQEYLDCGNSTVFFSATLLPIQYYRMLLSTASDDYAIYAETAFNKDNRLLLIGNDVSTKYTLRGPKMYDRFAEYIWNTVETKKGNYLVFFPSYRFLEEVYQAFPCYLEKKTITCLIQQPNMNEGEREEFLQAFEEEREEILIGFGVLGGIFSEGIDLAEDKLIGAIIIGTGLPQVCNEREILKQYFDKKNMRGFHYAYLYPGMNKVLQAAGRVIRTEEDRGVILLLDQRFQGTQYQEAFPREWAGISTCNLQNIRGKLELFWETTS
ncbi:MAG: ATP-dependent DNA helicase [Lachnospiraceae bacterium]